MSLLARNATNSTEEVTTSSTSLLEANDGRLGFVVTNNGATDVYITFGETATTSNGHLLASGDSFSDLAIGFMYPGAINAITASGTSDLVITKFS
jgi:hypothetical protein